MLSNMQLTPVDSSMISKAGYDDESQILRVAFLSTGKTVDYSGVPKPVYDGLMASKSKGIYVSNNVISCFERIAAVPTLNS
jgi:KTSC domain